MMQRIREEYDADLLKTNEPTEYKTDLNTHELLCSTCGRFLFVDKETAERYEKAMQHDLDNQFICPDCEREQEELAYT
jgi:hypothetical protein